MQPLWKHRWKGRDSAAGQQGPWENRGHAGVSSLGGEAPGPMPAPSLCLLLFPASSHCSIHRNALLPTSLWQKTSPLVRTGPSLRPVWGVSSSQPPQELPRLHWCSCCPALGGLYPLQERAISVHPPDTWMPAGLPPDRCLPESAPSTCPIARHTGGPSYNLGWTEFDSCDVSSRKAQAAMFFLRAAGSVSLINHKLKA